MIGPLDEIGGFTKLDTFWLPGRAHAAVAAPINIIAPGTHDLSPVNSPSFVACAVAPASPTDGYYRGNGSNQYLLQNLTIPVGYTGLKMQPDSAIIGARVSAPVGGVANPAIGQVSGSSRVNMDPQAAAGTFTGRLNSGTSTGSFGASDGIGHFTLTREASTGFKAFKNGASLGTSSDVQSVLAALPFDLALLRHASTYSGARLSCVYGGGSPNDTFVADLDDLLDAIFAEAPPP